MLTLYPEIQPYARHHLAVDDVHELYLEESGNPEGTPVLVVHGGPGGGVRTTIDDFLMRNVSGSFYWISAALGDRPRWRS